MAVSIQASSESRLEEPRSLRVDRWRRRSERARRRTRWRTRIEAIVQRTDRASVITRHDIDGDEISGALDAAVAEVTMLMSPLNPKEVGVPSNARYAAGPLTEDVTLVLAGKVLAVVRSNGGKPVVYRFFPEFSLQR